MRTSGRRPAESADVAVRAEAEASMAEAWMAEVWMVEAWMAVTGLRVAGWVWRRPGHC